MYKEQQTSAASNSVCIVGAGAIGKALAVFLTRAGKRVMVIRATASGQSLHEETFRVTMVSGEKLEAAIPIVSLDSCERLPGMVVVTSKSFGNVELAERLKEKVTGPLVILQNGLDVEGPFLKQGFQDVYRCVLLATSQSEESGVRFKPVAPSPVGVIVGKGIGLAEVVFTLSTESFPFRQEDAIQPFIWRKAIANSVFNSICPLMETDNGIFHRNEAVLQIGKRIVAECIQIARCKGVELSMPDVIDNILMISRASDGQLISTLQDIRQGRPTEIETLNFAFVRMAEECGHPEWALETRLLGELVHAKEKLARVKLA